jgi:DNA polymerase III delta prime subunit
MATTFASQLRLTTDQAEAVKAAVQTAESAGHMSLIGPAGCGKTTTIRAIAHEMQSKFKRKKVLLLAPTHKARQQFAADSLPNGVVRQTIHRFIGVSPTTWRDEDKFNLSNSGDLKRVEDARSQYSLVIVDESSMVCKEYAKKALDISSNAGVGIIFSGDPYQLPPISNGGQPDDDTEGPDIETTETTLAPQFIDAPFKVILNKVLRHGGPILEYATFIRQNWEIEHSFPRESSKDLESEIRVSDDPMGDFIRAYALLYRRLRAEQINYQDVYKQSPRALCFLNSSVHMYTRKLRRETLGALAGSQWVPGELVMVKHYTIATRSNCFSTFIPSATDAIVINSKIVDVAERFELSWVTPERKLSRSVTLEYSARHQILELQLINPNGSLDQNYTYQVGTTLLGDKESGELYKKLRAKLISTGIHGEHEAWKWLKIIKNKYRNVITSAFVMTVHSSQGSTFRDVYVCHDVLKADKDRNSMLYVAATRASQSITFGRH